MRQLKITKSITNRESASLDKYLQEIGRKDLITVDEEVELAQKIKQGDQAALDKLVSANLRFVVSVAKQYQNQGLSLPDLIDEGNLGLIKAAQKFDETRGFKFISYGGFANPFYKHWLNNRASSDCHSTRWARSTKLEKRFSDSNKKTNDVHRLWNWRNSSTCPWKKLPTP